MKIIFNQYLLEEFEKQGVHVETTDGVTRTSNDTLAQSIIDTFDPLPLARLDAIKRINEQSQSYMQAIEDEYPEFEKRTWPTQKAEVEAWVSDNNNPTPLLDTIALSRGMDRLTLLNKTYNKVIQYNNTAATLAGKRQLLESQINDSNDLDFICTVNFEA